MVGFTITSLLRPSLSLRSNLFPSSSSSSSSLKPQPFTSPHPQSLLVFASNNNNNKSELREKGNKREQQPTNGSNGEEEEEEDVNNKNSSKQKIPIFSFNWSTLLDPDPDNVLALGLTGLLTWASVQVLWQLLFVSFAIILAALKYSFIAALLIFILITLL